MVKVYPLKEQTFAKILFYEMFKGSTILSQTKSKSVKFGSLGEGMGIFLRSLYIFYSDMTPEKKSFRVRSGIQAGISTVPIVLIMRFGNMAFETYCIFFAL